ncbi:MAG TPA: non-homologous end-joining DNA ligase [Candidatus Sulfotelmatobacter sp.]|nr:non-homologous end-joining DNA ligase [Candidatus Sulfotelmatobacter sp.]
MALEEYKRKRRFEETPEPPPKVEKKSRNRFVVQKHRATRLHYDFRLEMEGVLKSWAVPKGPSLDPADKRLAMQVEDHPVSYFDFEGIIPEGNYGAGTVMVWDVGTWQPLSPIAVQGKYVPGTEAEAVQMLAKGDLKFRLKGKKLNGDFALVKMKGRRPGSKGTEWLMIKKHDDYEIEGYNIDDFDGSALTGRSMTEIGGDQGSAEWQSDRPAGRGRVKAPWLADAIAKLDKKKVSTSGKRRNKTTEEAEGARKKSKTTMKLSVDDARLPSPDGPSHFQSQSNATHKNKKSSDSSVSSVSAVVMGSELDGAVKRPMPSAIQPMLATPAENAFDDPEWLFEIKWDGYRALAFLENGRIRLLSRNQNELTARYPELKDLPQFLKAKQAIIDGEIVALDEQGRASFSLMQQRTGFRTGNRRAVPSSDVPVLYYAFDLIYVDGYDLRRVRLEDRKNALRSVVVVGDFLRYSDHYLEQGKALFDAACEKGLEGILAKKRNSCYLEKRSSEWLKIKITHRVECVIGGYTEPEGTRIHFGSLVLGLYDHEGRLIHVGQAGTGFDRKGLVEMWNILRKLEIKKNPFFGQVEALRKVQWVKPELVAEIEYSEWTHGAAGSSAPKLRAPVFQGLRDDKDPKECQLEESLPSSDEK